MIIELTARNGIKPEVRFGIYTLGMEHLSGAYYDHHHAALDAIDAEIATLRAEGLEQAKAEWDDFDMAQVIALLVSGVEKAESLEALRESEAFVGIVQKVTPLAEVMARTGKGHRLAMLERQRGRHAVRRTLWKVACSCEIACDWDGYLSAPGFEWPPVLGSDADKFRSVERRIDVMEALNVDDITTLNEATAEHLRTALGLTENEEGN